MMLKTFFSIKSLKNGCKIFWYNLKNSTAFFFNEGFYKIDVETVGDVKTCFCNSDSSKKVITLSPFLSSPMVQSK